MMPRVGYETMPTSPKLSSILFSFTFNQFSYHVVYVKGIYLLLCFIALENVWHSPTQHLNIINCIHY